MVLPVTAIFATISTNVLLQFHFAPIRLKNASIYQDLINAAALKGIPGLIQSLTNALTLTNVKIQKLAII
jgi:hypothetical protein